MFNFFYNRILFFILWFILVILHAFTLLIACKIDLSTSFIDSIVFNTLFYIIGIGVWFIVRYTDLFKRNIFELIINHISFAGLFVIIWMLSSTQILMLITNSSEYHQFLHDSIFFRSLFGILLYLCMVLFFYLRQNLEGFKQRIAYEATLNNMLKESQLQVLRTQINPHFLFNSLNSLNSLIVSKSDKASEMLIELSDYMRYSINSINEQFTPLKSELNQIERYVSIEKIRFGKRLSFNIDVCEKCPQIEVPAMILQPLVENAIKHGLYGDLDGVKIILLINIQNQYLHINIANNFDSENTSPQGTGLGLRNIHDRLLKLYGSKDLISITKENSIFNVKIRIPLK